MIKHVQDKFGKPDVKGPPWPDYSGNCWQVSVACILDLPVNKVPHFVTYKNPYESYRDFLFNKGILILEVPLKFIEVMPNNMVGLGFGVNDKGVEHCVVWRGQDLWHNPNPNNEGFKLHFVEYYVNYDLLEDLNLQHFLNLKIKENLTNDN